MEGQKHIIQSTTIKVIVDGKTKWVQEEDVGSQEQKKTEVIMLLICASRAEINDTVWSSEFCELSNRQPKQRFVKDENGKWVRTSEENLPTAKLPLLRDKTG